MSFFELTTAGAMFAKAKRELSRLQAEESVDHVYNFFTTAYHVTDYLKPIVSPVALKAFRNEPAVLFCTDVCKGEAHDA
jgi:hypothetical protein